MQSRRSWTVPKPRDVELKVALAVACAAFGIGADVAAGAPQGHALAFLDAAVGMLLLGFGATTHLRRPGSLTGVWLVLAGLTWFAGTLGWPFVYPHRGLLVLVILSYPSGRLRRSSFAAAVVAVAMLDSIVVPLARDDRLTIASAILIVIAALHSYTGSAGIARRAAAVSVLAALAFASVLALGAGLRLSGIEAQQPVLWTYDLVILGLAAVLFVDLLRAGWSEAVLRGLVADLGSVRGSPTLRDRLARALSDPTLVVGVWDDGQRAYLDESGAPVDPSPDGSGRIATRIDDDRAPLALLIHDEAAVDAAELLAPVAAVTRTAVANASLELQVEQRAREIADSRRRLVEAADGERRALQQTLARGPLQRLEQVSAIFTKSDAAGMARVGPDLLDEVEAGIAELTELANGVRPAELDGGLREALPALAARSPLDVTVLVRVERLPDSVEAAAYFVSSETLANTAKHAEAASARVEAVVDSDRLCLTVSDDGVGGADAEGSGLRGLRDRVEALGGRLRVESAPGAGTRVLAEIPCNSR
jgi:signal transduction histidine kinase